MSRIKNIIMVTQLWEMYIGSLSALIVFLPTHTFTHIFVGKEAIKSLWQRRYVSHPLFLYLVGPSGIKFLPAK